MPMPAESVVGPRTQARFRWRVRLPRRVAGVNVVPRMRAILAFLLLAGLATPVRAQSAAMTPARRASAAKLHFDRGQTYFDTGQYDLAIREFETGYQYQPLPLFLFDIANVARVAGMNDVASEYFRKYLRSSAPPGAQERFEAKRWLAEMRAGGTVRASRPGASKRADVHRLVGEMETALEAPPSDRETEAEPAQAPPPRAAAPPPAAVAPTPAPEAVVAKSPPPGPEKKPVYKAWWLWTTVGVVVAAGVGVGLYFALTQPYGYPNVATDAGTVRF